MIKEERIKLKTADGETIALWKIYSANQAAAKNVFLTHGTFSDRKVLNRMAIYLAENSFVCWLLEWRNHGASLKVQRDFNFETIAEYDFLAVFDYLFTKVKIKDLTSLTHSGGGLCLTMFLIRNKNYRTKIRRIVFFGCQAFGAGFSFRNYCFIFLAKYLSFCLGKVPARIAGARAHDETYFTMKQWFDWNLKKNFSGKNDFDYLERMPEIDIPILSICAKGDDFIAPKFGCEAFLNAFQNDKNELAYYALDQGHLENYNHSKILNSKNAQLEIWPKALAWLTQEVVHGA